MMAAAPILLYYRCPADLAAPGQRYNSATYPSANLYDSDNEPLLPRSHRLSALSASPYTAHTYSEHMYAAPSFHITPVSDDSIIPAIVVDVIPAERRDSSGSESSHNDTIPQKSKTGLVSRLVKKKKGKGRSGDDKEKKLTKVVYMPRKEYLKNFARGHSGEYIGTEPHRRWSEEELEQTFGKFRPPKRSNGMFWGRS